MTVKVEKMQTKNINWELFFIILFGLALGVLAKVPPFIQVEGLSGNPEVWGRVAALIFMEQFLIFGLVPAALGSWLAPRLGFKLPLLENWLLGAGHDVDLRKLIRDVVLVTLLLAVIGAGMQILIQQDLAALNIAAGNGASPKPQTSWWSMLLLSFSAGVTEEIVFRLGLLTVVAAVVNLIWKPRKGSVKTGAFWIANILTALLFSATHFVNFAALPAPIAFGLIWKTVAGNSLAALAFGWLYWKRGLGSAMLSHFLLDVFLYVGTPLLMAAIA